MNRVLEQARKDLEVSNKNAKDALENLKSLEKDAKAKYDKYLQIKRQYDMENYTWGVTKNPPVFDLPELSLEELEKTLENNTKTPDTVSKVKRERFAKTSKFKGKAIVKTINKKKKVLPNTGSTSTSTTGVAVLLAAVAIAARKRRTKR